MLEIVGEKETEKEILLKSKTFSGAVFGSLVEGLVYLLEAS